MEPEAAPAGGRAQVLPVLRRVVPVLLDDPAGSLRPSRRREREAVLRGPFEAAGVELAFQGLRTAGLASGVRAQLARGATAAIAAGDDGDLVRVEAPLSSRIHPQNLPRTCR